MFAPMVISAFYILGDLTSDNVLVTIEAIDKSWITYTVQVLFLFHLLSAFNIVLNPLWQGLEHICHFKNGEYNRLFAFLPKETSQANSGYLYISHI